MWAQTPWLLDGFPRTIGQARLLDEKLATLRQPLQLVINLDVPEEVVLSRILGELSVFGPSDGG
jgi:adenylate kinase family enzyme